MNPSAAFIAKNSTDDIASASYNWAPAEDQQSLWGLRTLHSNELDCAVPKSSFTRSVFAIWPYIQLHQYACTVYRSVFFTWSSRVNVEECAVCFAESLILPVFRVGLPSCPIPTAMLDSQSLNTSLLEVMISSRYKGVLIRDLSDLTLQIIFDALWDSMNVDSTQPID